MAQSETRVRRRPFRLSRLFATAGLLALVFYAAGFTLFYLNLPAPGATPAAVKADAIVVLTGEDERLPMAVRLLENGDAKRLLITGVNPATSKRQLKSLLHGGAEFDCCADLGFTAADTRGNALEAARWVGAHGYMSAIVITTSYHMPRSLLEFHAAMPDVELIPFPVRAEPPFPRGWQDWRRVGGEYTKYLASYMRTALFRLAPKRDTR